MDYVDNGPSLGDILAHVLKEKTGMRVDVQLREPVDEHSYEWQVVDEFGWIQSRSVYRADCVDWLRFDSNTELNYTLKRVRVESRGKISPDAKRFLDKLYEKYQPGKIDAIVMVRSAWGLGLKEAKDLVEDYLNDL